MSNDIILNLSDYVEGCPGESSYRKELAWDNPKEFFAIERFSFYQENEKEALMFINMRDNEPYTTMGIVLHLTLDLVNKQAYIDDIYSERYDDEELIDHGHTVVKNELCCINYIIGMMKCHFLGDFKLTVMNKMEQKLTGEEWEKYNPDDYNESYYRKN